MVFKRTRQRQETAENPIEIFRSLSKREFPTEMPHQRAIIEAYMKHAVEKPDVAIQLPTGSGKTLVGVMIGEWRRRKNREKIVYLCPTRQLVHQTAAQCQTKFGLEVLSFVGKKSEYAPADTAEYRQGRKIAITTYNSLFNVNPFFNDADTIIIDDAHTAENYIAGMWSVEIDGADAAQRTLHRAVANLLKPHISRLDFAIINGDVKSYADVGWVDKLPTPLLEKISDSLVDVLDEHVSDTDLRFPWSLIREHLGACHLYLSYRGILIRPIIPPTWSFDAFNDAKHRIYMSATLGEGGDLERLTGREHILRLPAPEGFDLEAVGRRFFIFPGMSLDSDGTEELRVGLMKKAGRSVVLTPSQRAAQQISKKIEANLGFPIFNSDDIERSKQAFVQSNKAVAVLAGRFDGIDFPKEECKLLFIEQLPKAANAQERFFEKKMGAELLLNSRIQTRVLQAIGRCTRSLQDFSAVVIGGGELQDYLSDIKRRKYLYPEFQAEIEFGVEESIGITSEEFLEKFDVFWDHDDSGEWGIIEEDISSLTKRATRAPFPAADELERAVKFEVGYQRAIWRGDFQGAVEKAKLVLAELKAPELRGYRALWHYMAGSAAFLGAKHQPGIGLEQVSEEQFRQAMKAAAHLPWTAALLPKKGSADLPEVDLELADQVERLEAQLLSLGTAHDRKFVQVEREILDGLASNAKFEAAHERLGHLLGFISGNDESDAAPDPWWLGRNKGLVFEDHAGGENDTVLGANKARQANGHPNWLRENVEYARDCEILAVIVSPVASAGDGAFPHLRSVAYWNVADFRAWAQHALEVLRRLRATLPGGGDLVWRAEAAQTLSREGLTMSSLFATLQARRAADILKPASKK